MRVFDAPARPFRGEPMCQQCEDLTSKILQFQRTLDQPLDPLTVERLSSAIDEMNAKKVALHPAGNLSLTDQARQVAEEICDDLRGITKRLPRPPTN